MTDKVSFVPLHPLQDLFKEDAAEYEIWLRHIREEGILWHWALGNEQGYEGPTLSMDEVEPILFSSRVWAFMSYAGDDIFEEVKEQVYIRKTTGEFLVVYKESFLELV
jgi:hypothetical protein